MYDKPEYDEIIRVGSAKSQSVRKHLTSQLSWEAARLLVRYMVALFI